jgi:hypothetical protein
MRITNKFLALAVAVCALAVASVALASGGATATATPSHVKENKSVQILVKGMRPGEKVKAVEVAPNGQKRTLFPTAGQGGSLIVKVKAQIKGKHTWTFTGRKSHHSATTHYVVT